MRFSNTCERFCQEPIALIGHDVVLNGGAVRQLTALPAPLIQDEGNMKTELKMTLKEAGRLGIMKQVESKRITLKKASEEIGIGYKQTKRAWKRYSLQGPAGLISKRRGLSSNNSLPEAIKKKILRLIKENYADYGPTLAKEKLQEKHQLTVSKETIRQLMIKEGLWKAKKVKEIKVHARRTRRSPKGELEQIDGSYKYWFEERGDKCCLLVCVNDATSTIMALMILQGRGGTRLFLVSSNVSRASCKTNGIL